MSETAFSDALDTLKEHLVGYDDGVEQYKLALLTGQHMLLVGSRLRKCFSPIASFM